MNLNRKIKNELTYNTSQRNLRAVVVAGNVVVVLVVVIVGVSAAFTVVVVDAADK